MKTEVFSTPGRLAPDPLHGECADRRNQQMPRFLRLSKKSAHETTSGCCLSRALRWRSVMPPQTPNSTLLSNASAPHSCITGQCRQITAALRCAAPRTKSSSGSVVRHSAFETQAIRSSASTLRSTVWAAAMFVLRAAGRVPATSCSLPPGRQSRPPSSGGRSQLRSRPHYANRCYLNLTVCLS